LSDPVLIEQVGAVTLMRLNRPQVHNAVNTEMATMFGNALADLDADDRVRAIVVHGGHPGSFCAGADLKAVAAGQYPNAVGHEDWGFLGLVKHFVSKPIIASVAGSAYAGGVELLLACDLVVAAQGAQLVLTEISHGLFASMGGAVRLGGHVPRKVAFEWLFLGRPIEAAEAAKWGLVNAVVPADQVLDVAMEYATAITAFSPPAVQSGKRAFYGAVRGESVLETAHWLVNDAEWIALRASEAGREGARAFAEKRPPQWAG
jgi:crotonobetainyl-CoA hydratase